MLGLELLHGSSVVMLTEMGVVSPDPSIEEWGDWALNLYLDQ